MYNFQKTDVANLLIWRSRQERQGSMKDISIIEAAEKQAILMIL